MTTPSGVVLIQRDAAGSDAPIRNVGGSRQSPLTSARSRIAGMPCPTAEVYTESTSGIRNSTRMPQAPMPSSSCRVDPQRMLPAQLQPRQQEAAQAQPAHERGQQHAQRNRGRPDHQLQQLVPDDFVDQRGAAAAGEQQQQQGQMTARTAAERG